MPYLKDKKIVIISHMLFTIPAEDLVKYFLLKEVKFLLFIGHPIYKNKIKPNSFYKIYENGVLVKYYEYKKEPKYDLIKYLKDIFLSILWVLKSKKKFDFIIALDNLNSFSAILLKYIGITRKVVYYTIDFTPNRFKNYLINNLYHFIDKFCLLFSDRVWNISPRISEGREKIRKINLKNKRFAKEIIVPIGVWNEQITKKNYDEIKMNVIVYAGGLLEHQGIDLLLESLPLIIKVNPNIKCLIIGSGDFKPKLDEIVKNLGINKYVQFTGYLEKHNDVFKLISGCSIGIAMYNMELSKWSYYADPSKIKAYLAAGLPVITTSLTYIAEILEKNNCGIVIKYDKIELANKINQILYNKILHKKMRENALNFIKDFNWEIILDKAIDDLLN